MRTSPSHSRASPVTHDAPPIGTLVLVAAAAVLGLGQGPIVLVERTCGAVDRARNAIAATGLEVSVRCMVPLRWVVGSEGHEKAAAAE